MGRILLLLLVGAVLVVVSPSLRARAAPVVQPVLNPLFRWQTRSQVREIARAMQADLASGRPLPAPREFSAYLATHFKYDQGKSTDSWGTPYYLTVRRRGATVGSAGEDRRPATGDDITASLGATEQR